jgi:hypothetical protein
VPFVYGRDLPARAVSERFSGTQMRGPGAVTREDWELVYSGGLVVAAVGPSSRVGCRVGNCGGEGAEGDADVEV